MNNDATKLAVLVNEAKAGWSGLDWESSIAGIGDRIRERRRVDPEEIGTWHSNDGSYASQDHHEEIRRLRTLIEDQIDDDTTPETREEIAALADQLAEQESAYVTLRSDAAGEHGDRAIRHAAAGDWTAAAADLENASEIEREFGDDPTWRAPRLFAEQIAAAAEDQE